MDRTRRVAMSLMAVAIAGTVAAADQRGTRRRNLVSTHAQTSTIPADGVTQVHLRLARGSVRIVGAATGGAITMHVSQRSTSTDARTVTTRVEHGTNGIRIVAVHPAPFPGVLHDCLYFDEELGDFWHYDVTVDVELSIPSSLAVHVRTMRGEVAVSGINGGVDVATNDGTIRLSHVSGDVSAAALGNVDLELEATSPRSQAITLSAYAGDITVRVPAGQAIRTDDRTFLSLGEMQSPLALSITRGRLIVVPY